PVTLSVDDLGEGFGLTAQTVAGIDPGRMAAYLETAMRGLVEALAVESQRPILSLSILSPQERRQLLVDFNATQADFPQEALIHQLFEEQVERNPDAVAVVFEDQSLSYGELNRRANRLAHHLIGLGVRPDERVAIYAERSLEMVVGLLAILKAGGAYVPLDPAYPADRLAYMLEDAAPVAVLTQRALADGLAFSLPTVLLDTQDRSIDAQADSNPDARALGLTSRHLAYVIYTSGSTGRPKGVMIEHAQVIRLFNVTRGAYHFNSNDVWCLFHSFAFDFSVWELWGALLHGGKLVIVPNAVARDTKNFYQLIIDQRITVLNQTPSAFKSLMRYAKSTCNYLRYVIFGGEALEPSVLKTWYEKFDEHHPQLVNMYGITETTVHATYCPLSVSDVKQARSLIGKRLADLRLYLLDAYGEPVPLGAVGEIYIGGAGVARGYLNRPELTAERFVRDPFVDDAEARMYKTGDLARYLPDGNLVFLGRNDFQVKIRGFRIELGEIEARLAQCEGVRDAVVIAREDVPGDKRLVAYVLPQPGVELIPAELRRQLAGQLAEYMLPSAYVMLDTLPLTPNGKLDRRALPAPDQTAVVSRGYEAPAGEVETALARIWQDLLGLEQVGRHDHFFELGGDSLLMLRVCSRIGNTFGLARDEHSRLLTATTLAEQARIIETNADREDDKRVGALVSLSTQSDAPPLFFAPGAGGHVPYLHALAGELAGAYSVWGMHLPGPDETGDDETRIEAMASTLVADIRLVQPYGPYRLGGHSLGGWVAFEIARQLVQQGEPVTLLVVVDTMPPGQTALQATKRNWSSARWAMEIGNSFARLTEADVTFNESEFCILDEARHIPYLHARLVAASVVPDELGLPEFAARVRAFIAHSLADYAPVERYPGALRLVVAADDKDRDDAHMRSDGLVDGWHAAVSGDVTAIRLPGDHVGIMRAPFVHALAAALREQQPQSAGVDAREIVSVMETEREQ
ncbi:non-ribosomal peptide synthetase, partial [Burkholderia singularis]|uniref:non-ribosomal peptide synthetase n=1 Tax=Burkholderia singularis TaxID=1503053 RepID=UPI000A927040